MNEKILHLSPCTVPLTVCFTVIPYRDPGDEGLDPELSGKEGGGLRPGEKRPAQ